MLKLPCLFWEQAPFTGSAWAKTGAPVLSSVSGNSEGESTGYYLNYVPKNSHLHRFKIDWHKPTARVPVRGTLSANSLNEMRRIKSAKETRLPWRTQRLVAVLNHPEHSFNREWRRWGGDVPVLVVSASFKKVYEQSVLTRLLTYVLRGPFWEYTLLLVSESLFTLLSIA